MNIIYWIGLGLIYFKTQTDEIGDKLVQGVVNRLVYYNIIILWKFEENKYNAKDQIKNDISHKTKKKYKYSYLVEMIHFKNIKE